MAGDALVGFLTTASLIAAIGAQNAFVLRQGLRREHVLPVVLVCVLADIVLIAAGIAGLSTLVAAHPVVLTLARYGGAAFLLGYATLAARRALRANRLGPADGEMAGLSGVLLTCLALTFLNPHVYLDTVVLLGSLAHARGDGRWAFGAGAVAASATWFFALGFGAHRLAPLLARPRAWQVLDGAIAVVMVGLAVWLLLGT